MKKIFLTFLVATVCLFASAQTEFTEVTLPDGIGWCSPNYWRVSSDGESTNSFVVFTTALVSPESVLKAVLPDWIILTNCIYGYMASGGVHYWGIGIEILPFIDGPQVRVFRSFSWCPFGHPGNVEIVQSR